MDSPRRKSYIWATWLTGLLAETDRCTWRSWYKAHFKYEKRGGDSDFDLSAWTKQHNKMTAARVEKLQEQGYTVKTEEENAFKLDGATATLSGKPDIVAIKELSKEILVVDEKSGRPRDSDVWQVLIYMFALPLVWAKGWRIDGEVEYKTDKVPVLAEQMSPSISNKIIAMVKTVGGPEEPERAPSMTECRFCDILACPDRWTSEDVSTDVSDIF